MKKFSNFVIKGRYIIFAILMVLFFGSIFLIPHVVINKDMTKYLPDGSSMKAGIDIINDEFPGTLDQKDIKVMFTELNDSEKIEVYNKLKTVENVTKVTYNDSETYNKGVYTLYILSSNYSYKSPEELKIEKDIRNLFNDYNVIVQHTMYATTTIPTLVLIMAFSALTIILFIMCASWIDPILFLFTIGVAVCLNFGTNIFKESVSESTFSLSAILQLVLSMDYSIILMNSYRQEKEENNTTPVEAMKVAFAKAFPSIMGSGLTTIIGLLMLIFMQFKLGMDLGIVMAKGVALSMLCVFTILPTLIIWSDKLIFKLQKKQLHVRMRKVVRYEFRHRFQILVLFIVIFVGAILFQGSTKVTFAEVKNDRIGEVFTPTNNAIIVYDNEDESKILKLMDKISKDKDVNLALSYKTTLALPMKANEFNVALKEMVGELPFNPEKIIKVLYYDAYNKNETVEKIKLLDLYNTLVNDIIPDPMFGSMIPEDVKNIILQIKPYASKEVLESQRKAQEISQIIGIEEDKVDLLYAFYFGMKQDYIPNTKTLKEFIKFIKESVLTNELIKDQIPESVINDLTKLETLTNNLIINAPLTNVQISQNLSLPQELVDSLFMYKFGNTTSTISLYDFVNYILTDAVNNPLFSKYFTEEVVKQLTMIQNIMDLTINDTKLSVQKMGEIIKVDNNPLINQTILKVLFTYNDYLLDKDSFKANINELLNFITTVVLPLPMLKDLIPEDKKQYIILANEISNSIVNEITYSPQELHQLIKKIDPTIPLNYIQIAYLLYGSINNYNDNWRLSIEQVMNHLQNSILVDERFEPLLTDEIKGMILTGVKMVEDNKKMLVGTNHSLIVLDLKVSEESAETTAFFNRLDELCKNNLTKEYHFVGQAPMNVEMEKGFNRDLILITILTAVAIFIIVAFTFRSFLIPLILVLIVQCGVFLTVCISGVISHSIYYLALLIVQCILMGATIDYGIVFTNYYKQNRRTMEIGPATDNAYEKSLHTIMTSGLIIVLVTGLIGLGPTDPAIGQICLTLSFGTLCAILLILFILPGLIMTFDKYIIKENEMFDNKKSKEE